MEDKKCYRCGSFNVAKVVPASLAYLPEIREDILKGKAVTKCCPAGQGVSGQYRCLDCDFEWDYYYEISQMEKEE